MPAYVKAVPLPILFSYFLCCLSTHGNGSRGWVGILLLSFFLSEPALRLSNFFRRLSATIASASASLPIFFPRLSPTRAPAAAVQLNLAGLYRGKSTRSMVSYSLLISGRNGPCCLGRGRRLSRILHSGSGNLACTESSLNGGRCGCRARMFYQASHSCFPFLCRRSLISSQSS